MHLLKMGKNTLWIMVLNFFFKVKHMHKFTEWKVVLCNMHGRILEYMLLKLNMRA